MKLHIGIPHRRKGCLLPCSATIGSAPNATRCCCQKNIGISRVNKQTVDRSHSAVHPVQSCGIPCCATTSRFEHTHAVVIIWSTCYRAIGIASSKVYNSRCCGVYGNIAYAQYGCVIRGIAPRSTTTDAAPSTTSCCANPDC